jgi:hypothetical protein
MLFAGVLSEKDYTAAQFLHVRPRPAFAVTGILLILLFVWAFAVDPSVVGFGIALWFVVFFALYVPWRAKRTFRQYKALSEPVSAEVREEGLYFKRLTGEGLVPWSHINKWRIGKTLVLLYPANNVFYLIPSHFFSGPEAFSSFVTILRERLGNAT